ncbi:hypothetical protein EDB80DRAFT_590209, partial [Ilyonectria destructans]
IPAPYSPYIYSVIELKPVMIFDLRLKTHYQGIRLLLCVLTPPQCITAVIAILEDEQDKAVLLQLYYQPEEVLVAAEEIVMPKGVCILKEPFFKYTTDSAYLLRADDISDIVWLNKTD